MICKHILLITFLNEPELIFLHADKWFQCQRRQDGYTCALTKEATSPHKMVAL